MTWPSTELGSLCSVITKGTTPRTLGQEYVSDGIPFLRAENLQGDEVCLGPETLYIDAETHRMLSRSMIYPGDVLISIAGTIGRCAIVPKDMTVMNCNQAVAIVRIAGPLERRFLLHWLKTGDAQRQMSGGKVTLTIANLSLGQIKKLRIPLPPISEQRRIVEILDQADALRKKRAEADAKAARILPALFYKMFGDPATNPKGWEEKPFDDAIDDATARFPKLQRNEYKDTGRFPVIDQGKELIAGYCDDESLVTVVDHPVIVFGDHTRIVKFVDFPFVAGADGSRVFLARRGFVPAFLATQLDLQPIPNLGYSRHMRELRRMWFIAPPLAFQEAYAKRFMDTRTLLQSQASSQCRIESLWQVLLHRAFTGDLTAKWREAHMKELLQEMEQQAKTLNVRIES